MLSSVNYFGRMLVAQARMEDLLMASSDAKFALYDIPTLAVR
jgi:PIN domain nuclease of toxin-antitoxin system